MDGHALLERLAAEPRLAALFFDLDGVLAPIVARPEDAAVPAETESELERLAGRYALVAVVTGRDGDDARARTGVEGIVYVGSHGLELEPGAEAWAERLQAFAADGGLAARAQAPHRRVPLPDGGGRAGGAAHAGGRGRTRPRRGLRRPVRPQGARGAAAARGEQGHGRDAPAGRARAAPRPVRGRRHDRPRRLPRARGARARRARRGRLAPRARPRCSKRPTWSSRAPPRSSGAAGTSDRSPCDPSPAAETRTVSKSRLVDEVAQGRSLLLGAPACSRAACAQTLCTRTAVP